MKKLLLITLILSTTFFLKACDDDNEETPSIELAIGDFHEGGVIFYLDEDKEHGMVCAVSEQSYGTTWKCDTPVIVSGADETAIGTGAQNTTAILSVCDSSPTIAGAICNSLELNGYTDWFLPSKDELNAIYENKDLVDATAIDNGGALLQSVNYWSSSLMSTNSVWVQTFAQGGSQYGNSEDASNHVRAVRFF